MNIECCKCNKILSSKEITLINKKIDGIGSHSYFLAPYCPYCLKKKGEEKK